MLGMEQSMQYDYVSSDLIQFNTRSSYAPRVINRWFKKKKNTRSSLKVIENLLNPLTKFKPWLVLRKKWHLTRYYYLTTSGYENQCRTCRNKNKVLLKHCDDLHSSISCLWDATFPIPHIIRRISYSIICCPRSCCWPRVCQLSRQREWEIRKHRISRHPICSASYRFLSSPRLWTHLSLFRRFVSVEGTPASWSRTWCSISEYFPQYMLARLVWYPTSFSTFSHPSADTWSSTSFWGLSLSQVRSSASRFCSQCQRYTSIATPASGKKDFSVVVWIHGFVLFANAIWL